MLIRWRGICVWPGPRSAMCKPEILRLKPHGLVSRVDAGSVQSLGWVLDNHCKDSGGAEQKRERFEAHALCHSLRLRPRCDGTSSRPCCPAPSFPSRLCGFVFPLVALPKAGVMSLTTCPLVREEVFSFVTNFVFFFLNTL